MPRSIRQPRDEFFSFSSVILSFFVAVLATLNLPENRQGDLWSYRFQEWRHTYHHHVELEFNLITQGTGVYLVDNEKYPMRRGHLIWLHPAQNHVLVQESADFAMWIGVCKPGSLAAIATDAEHATLHLARATGEICRRLPPRQVQQLCALLEDVHATKDRAAHFNAGLGYAFLTAWRFFEHARTIPFEDVHPAVEKIALLLQRTDTDASLAQLSRQAGLSAPRLSRLFKQQTGVSLVDFRNRQRLGRFMQLYGTGYRRTMLAAALAAGFGSYPQFHRVYKKHFGRPPRSPAPA